MVDSVSVRFKNARVEKLFKHSYTVKCPVLPFLAFLEFLAFFPCEEFLVFLSVFPFFSRDLGGSVGIKNPCFLGGFPCLFPKKQGKEGQGVREPFVRGPRMGGWIRRGWISRSWGAPIFHPEVPKPFKISGLCPLNLSAPKSQRFLRFAIAMPIANPRNGSDFRDKRKQCCVAI